MAKRTDYQITIDDALTKELNKVDQIHDYLVRCSVALNQRFQGDPRVFFYVKGSAALSRYLASGRVSADKLRRVCARSDWDTQLVINPWLSRAEWFTTFQECVATIRECLDGFEEELLGVFAGIFLPQQAVDPRLLQGKSADGTIRKEQNALGKALREAVAASFGQLFLDACLDAKYIANGPKHWDLPWQNIRQLAVAGKVKDILELDIQAHSQATLTFALFHPGQSLHNLNSIMTGRELDLLTATTRAVSEAALPDLDAASDTYDRLWMQLISETPEIVNFLKGKALESLSEVALISNLPQEVVEGTINSLPGQDKVALTELWQEVQVAKAQQSITGDGGSIEEVRFGEALGVRLKANQTVATRLGEWCLANLTVQPAMLAAFAALNVRKVTRMLSVEQKALLDKAGDEVDAQFDRYRDKPDPEDVAEAEKRETETLAPFTLVSQEKGSRRIGSILENMTIRDFYLFRLMIRCQLSNRDATNRLIPDAQQGVDFDTFKQQFKFRAELLDISVPRDDSLETAEQWAHVRDHIRADDRGIPLPDGSYFLDEYILMFREVLDKKSSSAHKFTKRLERACLIAGVYADKLGAEGLAVRRARLAERYPVFAEALAPHTVPIADANLLVFMRMCEQLTDSYDLAHNDRLRDDSRTMLLSFKQQIGEFLGQELTEEPFLELMKIYAHLSRLIYNNAFVLAHMRRAVISDEKLLKEFGGQVLTAIGNAFGNDSQQIRCAVVEDFAIADDPDLPDSLKRALPLNVLTIIAYTSDDGRDTMAKVATDLDRAIRALSPGNIDTVGQTGGVLGGGDVTMYGRYLQDSKMSVFMKIKFVFDDNRENWVALAYSRDLRAIVKQYRRSLPAYTEYYALNQRKDILRQMETVLTTY